MLVLADPRVYGKMHPPTHYNGRETVCHYQNTMQVFSFSRFIRFSLSHWVKSNDFLSEPFPTHSCLLDKHFNKGEKVVIGWLPQSILHKYKALVSVFIALVPGGYWEEALALKGSPRYLPVLQYFRLLASNTKASHFHKACNILQTT